MRILSVILLLSSILYSTSLPEVRDAIKRKKYEWTASENWITRLPASMQKNIVKKAKYPVSMKHTGLAGSPAPANWDWRNHNGKNYVTSVKDQGGCGSCWAHAACAILESAILIDTENPSFDLDLSEQYLVSTCLLPEEGWPNDCGGGSPLAVVRFLAKHGTVTEECYPYSGRNSSCDERCELWFRELVKATTWAYVNYPGIEWMKENIQTGPIYVSFMVYYDFFYYDSGVYKRTSSTEAGLHDIATVGWSDTDSCWICKNSWGENWGENGFFRIAYYADSKFGIETSTLTYDDSAEYAQQLVPNGGEKYNSSEKVKFIFKIKEYDSSTDYANLYLSTDFGVSWIQLATVPVDTGYCYFTIPALPEMLAKVASQRNPGLYDISDSTFSGRGTGFAKFNRAVPAKNSFCIFPQPARSYVNIALNSYRKTDVSISIYNLIGIRILNKQCSVDQPAAVLRLSLKNIEKGIYFIEVRNSDFKANKVLVID
ncbi:MAG: T9SS type A sorting domain-containing protein [Candidatus Coatesbacteria bacterium]|nr:T9SS type A sorting domain-containing protein [Candidatus Coatesbacteria bacterium]